MFYGNYRHCEVKKNYINHYIFPCQKVRPSFGHILKTLKKFKSRSKTVADDITVKKVMINYSDCFRRLLFVDMSNVLTM